MTETRTITENGETWSERKVRNGSNQWRWERVPAQAPDKAGEREGLYLRWRGQRDPNLPVPPTSREGFMAGLDATLAPQPNGTEASRGVGVGVEIARAAFDKWFAATGLESQHKGLTACAWHEAWAAARAANPTPPLSPDSAGPAGAEDAIRISFEISLSPEGWLRVSGIEPRGLILSSSNHDALLTDIGPAIRGLLQHSGKWPLPNLTLPAPIAAPVRDDGARAALALAAVKALPAEAMGYPATLGQIIDDISLGRIVKAVLAPQPSGTEASRGAEDTGRLRQSDQLRIIAGYHRDKLPAGVAQELCDLADEWDEQVMPLSPDSRHAQQDQSAYLRIVDLLKERTGRDWSLHNIERFIDASVSEAIKPSGAPYCFANTSFFEPGGMECGHCEATWPNREKFKCPRMEEALGKPPLSPSEPAGRKTADVGVFGPIDGMGNHDLSGSYIGLSVSGKHFAHGFRISLGAAEVLSAELAGLLGHELAPPLSPDSTGPYPPPLTSLKAMVAEKSAKARAASLTLPAPIAAPVRDDGAREVWGVEDVGHSVWVGVMRPDGSKLERVVYGVQDLEHHTPEARARYVAEAHLVANSVNAALNQSSPIARPKTTPTDALVDRFALALKAKLRQSEDKRGWRDGQPNAWMRDDWQEDCQTSLAHHVWKGDPIDVAAFAAFYWHHGWPTWAPRNHPEGKNGHVLPTLAADVAYQARFPGGPLSACDDWVVEAWNGVAEAVLSTLPAPAGDVPGEAQTQEGGR